MWKASRREDDEVTKLWRSMGTDGDCQAVCADDTAIAEYHKLVITIMRELKEAPPTGWSRLGAGS